MFCKNLIYQTSSNFEQRFLIYQESMFMTLCKVGFLMNQHGLKKELPATFN
jgi:hypothetical protein